MSDITLEQAQLKELADNYEKKEREALAEEDKKLDADQRDLFNYYVLNGSDNRYINDLRSGLISGKYANPSDFFNSECSWLFGKYIPVHQRESFLHQADKIRRLSYTSGYMRRPYRSENYASYISRLISLIIEYRSYRFPKTLKQIITGDLNTEEKAYIKLFRHSWLNPYDMAYQIDKGCTDVINWAAEALDSGSDISSGYSFIRGIVRSSNAQLHEKLGKLLLAARLQEGLRQAICENADEGTPEAFMLLLRVIRDNDLIRYSSVKRSAAVWTGLAADDSKDLERISGKTLDLMINCMEDQNCRTEYLESDDAMKIYIGLWSCCFSCVENGIAIARKYLDTGTHQQLITSAFFIKSIQNPRLMDSYAKSAVLSHNELKDLMAICVPCLFSSTSYYRNGSKLLLAPEKYLNDTFESREEAQRVYEILMSLYSSIDKKKQEFSPCVFPWNSEALTKSDIIRKLSFIAAVMGDNEKIDEICTRLSDIDVSGYGSRSGEIRLLLSNPATEVQLRTLVAECADKEERARETAFGIIEKEGIKLSTEHYRQFEDMLRYKAADIRAKVISVLMELSDDELYDIIKRLISDKKEEKRTAGLDMIIQLSKNTDREPLYQRVRPLIGLIGSPTSKEVMLMEQLDPEKAEEVPKAAELFDDNDVYVSYGEDDYLKECRSLFLTFFPNSEMGGKKKLKDKLKDALTKQEPDFFDILRKLDTIIQDNKEYEYTNQFGERVLYGNSNGYEMLPDGSRQLPLREIWDKFYDDEIRTPERLIRAMVYAEDELSDGNELSKFKQSLYGSEYSQKLILKTKKDYFTSIFIHLINCKVSGDVCDRLGMATADYISTYPDTNALYELTVRKGSYSYKTHYAPEGKVMETDNEVVIAPYRLSFSNWFKAPVNENIRSYIEVTYRLMRKFGYFELIENGFVPGGWGTTAAVSVRETDICTLLRAVYYNVITERCMFRYVFKYYRDRSELLSVLSNIVQEYRETNKSVVARKRSYAFYRFNNILSTLLCGQQLNDDNRPLVELASDLYNHISDIVLESEIRRGDTLAAYSDFVNGFSRVYGMERFVQILASLGKDTLERSEWNIGRQPTRKASLSHLLGVSMPVEGDDAAKLKQLIRSTDVTEKRLVEAALYAPQWMDIIDEYLGWDGFKSGCWYFIAHMNSSIDDPKKAVIAKYTPISSEDLANGAFDPDWFREILEKLGEKRFDMIYAAAKYITDGAKHSRARKYADAVMGRLDKTEAEKNITDKRNKDTLMAYALIPIGGDKDILARYVFIQDFRKQSRQFGAQRRASENVAADMALQNLAKNAGFDDVTRLTLRMETKMFDDIRSLTEENIIDEISLRLVIGCGGDVTVCCKKKGKELRSIPAKYKKNELVIRMNEVRKQLTEQYRRTRNMFEQSMEDRTIFRAGELAELTSNPIVHPIIKELVFKCGDNTGFLGDMKLISASGSVTELKTDSELIVAHPYDLYKQGSWTEYQKLLFDKKRIQPFRQVFRELYVITEEEIGRTNTLRFAGNQIQPAKTAAVLRTRRWIADIYDGLQKIYYKENIIARIYALADWFSPSDIEAPALEWVEFYRRDNGEHMKNEDIPPVIFSEVMRDTDLAVSVAHAGGVDPETSHSTIEMRRAICEFTMPLFRLTNVRFEKSHAFIKGSRGEYTIHLGSGVVHCQGKGMVNVLPVHSQHRGKLFLPFVDEDPKTAQIISEILLFAEDSSIKDPFILDQIL